MKKDFSTRFNLNEECIIQMNVTCGNVLMGGNSGNRFPKKSDDTL